MTSLEPAFLQSYPSPGSQRLARCSLIRRVPREVLAEHHLLVVTLMLSPLALAAPASLSVCPRRPLERQPRLKRRPPLPSSPRRVAASSNKSPFTVFPPRCALHLDQFSKVRPSLRSTRHLDAQRLPPADVVPWDVDLDLSKQLAFDLALAWSSPARVLCCLLLTQDQSSLRSYF